MRLQFASTAHWSYYVARDLCVGANMSYIFEIPDPDLSFDFAIYTLLGFTINIKCYQNGAPLCVKGHTTVCACATSREL